MALDKPLHEEAVMKGLSGKAPFLEFLPEASGVADTPLVGLPACLLAWHLFPFPADADESE